MKPPVRPRAISRKRFRLGGRQAIAMTLYFEHIAFSFPQHRIIPTPRFIFLPKLASINAGEVMSFALTG